jgi:DNA-binding NarL/FixJ family response regulator
VSNPRLSRGPDKPTRLTARECEVLILLAEGLSLKEVAHKLGVSVKTVDAHTYNIHTKLNLHNRIQMVWWAIQAGLVRLEPIPKEPGETQGWEPRRIR